MSLSKVLEQHRYALTESGIWVDALSTQYSKGVVFYCDCPDRHSLKLVKSSGRAHKRAFRDYFAHINSTHCCGGGESEGHRLAKHRLRGFSKLCFVVAVCQQCGCATQTLSRAPGDQVRIEVRSADGRWRYDCVLVDAQGAPRCVMEVVHTHASGADKVAACEAPFFAEFAVVDIQRSRDGSDLLNLQPARRVLCATCIAAAYTQAWREQLEDEIEAWEELESQMAFNYEFARARTDWERAMLVVRDYAEYIDITVLGKQFSLNTGRRLWEHGYLFETCGFDHMPTNEVALLIMADRATWPPARLRFEIAQLEQRYGIKRPFVSAVFAFSLARRLGDIQTTSQTVVLKNCLYAILFEHEAASGYCAFCDRQNHAHNQCSTVFCLRCGRYGHKNNQCFAKSALQGTLGWGGC
jgi:hypothetical protein